MGTLSDQVAQLEAAITAQEGLRAAIGDAAVDISIAALRQQAAALRSKGRSSQLDGGQPRPANGVELASRALADLQSQVPAELAAKARATHWTEGERRQVTLLFADLSGFTAVSETADPELIRSFQHDLFRELARIIYQYEGFVEKFVGDAVLAIFGAPVAHEDDAERALRVALAMRERMSALNRRWSERLKASLTLHVGINTGEVVAGKIGHDAHDATAAYAVTGDTVNTASRLQDAAEPNQILVSRTTYRLAQGAFTFQAHEPITVKNKREPLAVYELLRARPLPGKLRGIPGMAEAFVGREADLKLLSEITDKVADTAQSNSGHIVLITGEAGIGKSRLVAEWRKQTDDHVLWLEGRCFAHTSTHAYGPMLDMLRRFAGIVDDDSERRARKRLDVAVDRLLSDNSEARAIFANLLAMRLSREETTRLSKLHGRDLRERVLALSEELLRNLARDRPLVFYLDDMHWADTSTIDLVSHLLALTVSERLVIAIAARPDQESAMTARLRETLASDEYRTRSSQVTLEALPDSSSLDMVRELLRTATLPARLAALVTSKAEGNPFFVEEIIRALIERGALVHDADGWATTPLLERISDTIPDTLQGLIMARIDRLPDETKHVVQHAAVIGRTFLYRVLLAIAQHSPSLDADLSHLERTSLIRQRANDPEVEYTFQHALTQDMAYQTLLKSRSRDLHRRVGEAMERIFAGRLGEFYPTVAEHFRKGEVWDKAGEYHVKAGDHASHLFAPEALIHYRHGLEALEHPRATADTKRRRVHATVSLAREVLLGAAGGDIAECTQRLHTAETLAASLAEPNKRATTDDRLRLALVHAWLGRAYGRQDPDRMAEYFDKVLEVTNEVRDPELAAFIGQVLLNQGHFARAESVLAGAVPALQDRGSWLEWVSANGGLAMAMAAQNKCDEGLNLAKLGVARSKNLRGQALTVIANNYLAFTHLFCGEWEQAAEVSRANLDAASTTRNQLLEAIAATSAVWAATRNGRLDEAKKTLLEHDAAVQHPVLFDWRAAIRAEMALEEADHASACSLAKDAVAIASKRKSLFAQGHAERVWGRALAAQKKSNPEVDTHMGLSRDLFKQGNCHVEVDRTHEIWDELRVKRGDPPAR